MIQLFYVITPEAARHHIARGMSRGATAKAFCMDWDVVHGEAPPITALLCCGIGTEYARKIRSDLINRGVIRPRTSCVRAWEEMRGAK